MEAELKEVDKKVEDIIDKYNYEKGYLVNILQDVQSVYNYLPKEAMRSVSKILGVPVSRVYAVATFYKAFSLKPRGKYQLSLCMGTACHVRGSPRIGDVIKRKLGIEEGETTDDLKFTYETVNCLGACALGPILVVNGEYHGHMTISKVEKLLKKLDKEES